MTAQEEAAAIRDAARGDAGAFEKLVLEHQKRVYNLALKLTGNPDDAMDASQEAFLKAYQNLRSFRGESRFSVWLYRLAYNACMDILKKSRRDRLSPMPTDEEGAELEFADDAPQPDEVVERREELSLVREAVLKLDEDKRQIILMREYQGMSYADISRALGLEEGTVKSRLARARAALAENLKKSGTFTEETQSNNQTTKRKGGRGDA